jgi:carbon monoxide dehydrogenase subunit G
VGTLLIPDISGFTEFVAGVELSHSRHIIAELLEIIIDANRLGFEISEIEGDAVLFYRLGPPPSLQTLKEQAETFYLKFHQYLRQIKRDTLCKCGACQNVGKLTLKIIAHYGEMSLTKIKNRVKLIGKDVIAAHRLLKNHVPSSEYLLVSQALLKATGENFPAPMHEYREQYSHLGELIIYVHALSPLRSQIPAPPEPHYCIQFPNPIVVSKQIQAPLESVHALLFDFEKMPLWNPGLVKVEYDATAPARVGFSHTCFFDGSTSVVTIDRAVEKKNEVIVANRMKIAASILQSSAIYHLKREANGTRLDFIFSYKPYPVIGRLLDKMVRPRLARMFERTCEGLKRVAEEAQMVAEVKKDI